YGSRSTAVQTVLRALAVLAAVGALLLVSFPGGRKPRVRTVGATTGRALGHVRVVDSLVGVALLGWWVVGPAFFDDGWVAAGQANFAKTGNPSTYFDSFGVSSSLQYWLLWAEQWLFQSTHALVLLRLPALVCLAVTWALCRWLFGRLAPAAGRASLWALATAFLVGAFAWGMTLRPEPVIALLVTAVMACTVLFLEKETTAPLVIAAVLIALAVSAHPAGILALAPLLVAAPAL